MDPMLDQFTREKGWAAAQYAVEQYRNDNPDFDASWQVPMAYASGVTAARLAVAMSKEWVVPLKRQARMAGLSALIALLLLALAMSYVWSLVNYSSFVQFLVAFAPAVAALVFSGAKSYKAWAEARKHLAEAKAIASSGMSVVNER
jgi:hypothetical protein